MEKISKGGISKETLKKGDKSGSIKYKQAKNIAPKSKTESRAHYAQEPTRGLLM